MNFEYVWERLSPMLADFGSSCLAGGCVRDQLLGRTPKDFDLFVLSDKKDFAFDQAKKDISARLSAFTKTPPAVEWHKSEPYLVASIALEGAEIQVMVNPAKTMPELISTFDWNVCLFGYDGAAILKSTDLVDIKEGGTLKLHKVTFPLSTLRRGFRFSERFKMKLDSADIETLCRAIIEKAEKGQRVGPSGNEPDMPALQAQLSEEEVPI